MYNIIHPKKTGMKRAQKEEKKSSDARKVDFIIEQSCLYFNQEREVLFSKCRKRELVTMRYMVFYYLIKSEFDSALVGRAVGRDHSTVLYGVDVIKDLMDAYEDIRLQHKNASLFLDKKLKTYHDV